MTTPQGYNRHVMFAPYRSRVGWVVPAVALAAVAGLADDPIRRQPPAGSRPVASAPDRPRDSLAAVRSLNVIYPRIDFQELPLDEFAEWLGRQTQVNVVVRWPRLAAAGVERDTPITLHRKEALLSAVLRDVLKEAGGEQAALGYRAAGNVITISTRADLDRLLLTRTYEIEDLMIRASDFEALGDIMAHPNVPRRRLMRSAADDRKAPQQELIDVITATLYPDTWKVNGGSGTLRVFRGQLIVRNTPEVHQALAGGLRPVGQAVSTED